MMEVAGQWALHFRQRPSAFTGQWWQASSSLGCSSVLPGPPSLLQMTNRAVALYLNITDLRLWACDNRSLPGFCTLCLALSLDCLNSWPIPGYQICYWLAPALTLCLDNGYWSPPPWHFAWIKDFVIDCCLPWPILRYRLCCWLPLALNPAWVQIMLLIAACSELCLENRLLIVYPEPWNPGI